MKFSYLKDAAVSGAMLAAVFTLTACQKSSNSQEAQEQANLKKAIYCMEVLEVDLDIEKAGRECFSPTYIQHMSHVPDGKDGVLTYFQGRIKKFPEMKAEIKRSGADGDLVWIHVHFKRTPDSLGSAVIHIFRMEDGKFAEHWGVGRAVSEKSVHGNSVF